MKKSIFILASLFCLKGFSQQSFVITDMATSATITANSIVNAITTAAAETDLNYDIRNISSSTKSYNLKRYDVTLHATSSATADAHFCFDQSCYTYLTTQGGPLSLAAGQSASQSTVANNYLTAELVEANTVGYSAVKYSFINAATPSDSLQFTIKYNGTTGINEISNNLLSSLELFPNPATDATVLKITSQKAMDAKVLVYNALGAVVSEMPIAIAEGKNKIDLNLNNLNSGIYFTQIKMANSSVTKKLIVK